MQARAFAHLVHGKREGNGYRARCPAHNDTDPSLSIHDGEKGVVLHCFGGCTVEAVCAAVGLQPKDLFRENGGPTPGPRTLDQVYAYHDELGTLLFEVCRFFPKAFRQRRPNGQGGWLWSLGDVRRVLYQLPDLLAGADPVIVVEGERDVDHLRALGFTATTNPGGAGKWRGEYATFLKGRAVVLLPDNDAPGRNHMDAVGRSVASVAASVQWLALEGLSEKGDVSDWVEHGHTADELRALIAKAATWEEVQAGARDEERPADVSAADASPGPVLTCLADVRPEPVTWLWPGRVPVGKLSLVVGDPGLGKSSLMFDAASRVTRGALWPDGAPTPEGTVLLLTAEDGLADTVRPRVDVAGGDVARITIFQGVGVKAEGGVRLPHLSRDVAHLEQAILRTKPVLVIIDPVSAYLGKVDSKTDADVRAVLAPVAQLAERHQVAVVGIMHLSKDQQRRALYRTQGSLAFVAAARAVFAVGGDPATPGLLLFFPLKANLAPFPPGLGFRLESVRHPDGFQVSRLAWEPAPIAVDAEAILGPPEPAEERGQRAEAEGFLRILLAEGPMPAERVMEEAKQAGIAKRTLDRAKGKVGARSVRKAGLGGQGTWEWTL